MGLISGKPVESLIAYQDYLIRCKNLECYFDEEDFGKVGVAMDMRTYHSDFAVRMTREDGTPVNSVCSEHMKNGYHRCAFANRAFV